MLEPSPRYSGPSRLQLETHSLDTAVDLSRKSGSEAAHDEENEESEDEAPLDLKVGKVGGNIFASR